MRLIVIKKMHNTLFMQVALPALLLLVFTASVKGQVINDKADLITIDAKHASLQNILSEIESQSSFRFAYDADLFGKKKNITFKAVDQTLTEVLNRLLKETGIGYHIIGNQVILQKNMPGKITLRGYTRDRKTGELLIGTNIFFPDLQRGIVSNSYGFYSITVPFADSLNIEISYAGFETMHSTIKAQKDMVLDVQLDHHEDPITFKPVLVTNEKDNVSRNQVDLIDLTSDIITAAPAVSGNGDIINSVQLSAGVQPGLDGTAGYFVRGGNSDQNQVVLDEATLYNPGHLFGMVSVFNSPAIKKATLLKGGFPASYGDYLSSVLDVNMKDGSNQQSGGEVQLGTMASSLALYGPVIPNKSSFFLSARRSTIDWMLRPLATTGYFSNYYFYDVNAKLQFQLSSRDKIFFSFYQGYDKGAFKSGQGEEEDDDNNNSEDYINYHIAFGNRAFSTRWNHVFSKKLFSNTSLVYNTYFQRVSTVQGHYFAELYSGIRDVHAKTDFFYYPHVAHRIRFGAGYLRQSLFPATVSNKLSSSTFIDINETDIPAQRSERFAGYLSDDFKITHTFNVYAGIRLPVYRRPGIQYINIEPRVSVLYLTGANSSVKLAYSSMHQYINLVQSYNATFPADVWIGSSSVVKPQGGQQVSAGFYKNFRNKMFQTSVEVYYKKMDNQLLLKGGTTPGIDNNMEHQLIFGKGWSYGTELMLRKTTGKLKGWLCYSFTNAFQQFDSLNHGNSFPLAMNRKHSLYLLSAYDLNPHWSFSATLCVNSGRAVTLNSTTNVPSASRDDNPLYEEEDHQNNSNVFNHQLSPYNRLDASITYRKSRNTTKRVLTSEWVLSVYNVYAHKNTQFYYRLINPETKQPYIKEIPMVPVIPTVTYIFRF